MFEMIFINIDDTKLYQQHDFTELVRDELKKSDLPYAVHIAAPKYYYLDSSKELPIFISTKENNIDNKSINTNENGSLIFSNNKTADIYISKTFINTKERPFRAKKRSTTPPDAPLGWTPPKTTYFKSKYRLLNKNEIPQVSGIWTVVEHSGNFISNSQTIEIKYKDEENKGSLRYIDSKLRSTEDLGVKTTFSWSNLSPTINSLAFNLKVPTAVEISNNKALVLQGNFSINNSIDISRGYLPIHLVLSSNNVNHNQVITLKVPGDKIVIKNDNFEGYFSIDLLSILNNTDNKNIQIEENLYITLISGPYISKIFTIFAR